MPLLNGQKTSLYIAQGFALAACAELQIDSCPMEGFDPAAVAKILESQAISMSLSCSPIGYRAVDEHPRPKFRFTKEKVFTEMK